MMWLTSNHRRTLTPPTLHDASGRSLCDRSVSATSLQCASVSSHQRRNRNTVVTETATLRTCIRVRVVAKRRQIDEPGAGSRARDGFGRRRSELASNAALSSRRRARFDVSAGLGAKTRRDVVTSSPQSVVTASHGHNSAGRDRRARPVLFAGRFVVSASITITKPARFAGFSARTATRRSVWCAIRRFCSCHSSNTSRIHQCSRSRCKHCSKFPNNASQAVTIL